MAKLNVRNTLKFWGAKDEDVNAVKNWGPSYEERPDGGYADENEIRNYYARAHGLAGVRDSFNKAGIDNSAIGYDFGTNMPMLQGRHLNLGQGAVNLGGQYYARPENIDQALGPRLSAGVQGRVTALQNSLDPVKAQQDPYYMARQGQIEKHTEQASNALSAQLAAQGILGGGSLPAMQRFTSLQDESNRQLMLEAVPQTLDRIWSKNKDLVDVQMGAEDHAATNQRADAALTGLYNGQPTMATQGANMDGLMDTIQKTGQIPNGLQEFMKANPQYQPAMNVLSRYGGQETTDEKDRKDKSSLGWFNANENATQGREQNAIGWYNAETNRINQALNAASKANPNDPQAALAAAEKQSIAELTSYYDVSPEAARAWFWMKVKMDKMKADEKAGFAEDAKSGDRHLNPSVDPKAYDKMLEDALSNSAFNGEENPWLSDMFNALVKGDAEARNRLVERKKKQPPPTTDPVNLKPGG